jgi:DNA-binding NarL/FixJ family response regulator
MKKIKLYLVDDHKLFIKGIISLFEENNEMEVVGHAYSAKQFLNEPPATEPDVILVDINMPDMTGIELTRIIKEKNPKAKILALTMFEDIVYIQKMIRSGANGYVLKSADMQVLIEAIKTVANGGKFWDAEIRNTILEKVGAIDSEEFKDLNQNKLSKRELEILYLITKELSNSQIAEKLFVSERTIETHRKNIMAKTKASNTVGLVKLAIREGLVYF